MKKKRSPHNLAGFTLMTGMDRFIYQNRKLKAWLSQNKNGPSVYTAAAILNLMAAILDSPPSHM